MLTSTLKVWEADPLGGSDTQQLFWLLLPLWHSPCLSPTHVTHPLCTPQVPPDPSHLFPHPSCSLRRWAEELEAGLAGSLAADTPPLHWRISTHTSKRWRKHLWEWVDFLVNVTLLNKSSLGLWDQPMCTWDWGVLLAAFPCPCQEGCLKMPELGLDSGTAHSSHHILKILTRSRCPRSGGCQLEMSKLNGVWIGL